MARKSYYGIIGNGETVALISPQAGIDWLCLPRADGKLVFTRALDPLNGRTLSLSFYRDDKELIPKREGQSYKGRSNILETRLKFQGLGVNVIDFMPWKGISEVLEDQRIIYRLIKIKNTSKRRTKVCVRAKSEVKSESDFAELAEGEIFYKDENFVIGSMLKDNEDITIGAGKEKSCLIALVYGDNAGDVKKSIGKLKYMDAEKEMKNVQTFWRNWLARGKKVNFKNKEYEEAYYRSLLLIKLLIYDKTGAVLAAPTASFPATPGGSENWDYRFMWIRDAFFAFRSMLKAGHTEEARKQLELFYSIQMNNGHWNLPFYTLDGEEPGKEIIVEGLQGPRGEDNIRLNNEAKDQLQLDSEGSMLHLTYLYYRFTKDKEFLRTHWKSIRKTANWICRNYDRKENGLWELREGIHKPLAHWSYGKVLCYAGLRSAIEIAETVEHAAPDEWYSTEHKLQKMILKNAWSQQRKAFLQTFEKDAQLDISALAIEDYGLLSPLHSKMESTAKAMEEHLVTEGNGVKRFEDAQVPFYLPTLWLSIHFTRAGNREKARKYITAALGGSTELYLCAEHFDPVNGEQYGNYPQTFSAAAIIDALITMKETRTSKLFEKFNLTIKEAFRYISEM